MDFLMRMIFSIGAAVIIWVVVMFLCGCLVPTNWKGQHTRYEVTTSLVSVILALISGFLLTMVLY